VLSILVHLLHLEKYDELLALTTQYDNILPKRPDIPLTCRLCAQASGTPVSRHGRTFTETLARDPEVATAYVNAAIC